MPRLSIARGRMGIGGGGGEATPLWQRYVNLYGASIAEIWPLTNNANGVYAGLSGTPSNVTFDGKWANFNGTNSYINILSAGLQSAFNGVEGGWSIWCYFPVGVWTDGIARRSVHLVADTNNRSWCDKAATPNNTIFWGYRAGAINSDISIGGNSYSVPFMLSVTWSKAANKHIVYRNGEAVSPGLAVGDFLGSLSAAILGASTTGAGNNINGALSHFALFKSPPSAAQLLQAYNTGLPFFPHSPGAHLGRFVWLSDMHWGWDVGQNTAMLAIAGHINDLNPDTVIVTGDTANDALEAQYQSYINFISTITAPVSEVPGNHDELANGDATGNTPGQVADYAFYDLLVGERRFVVDVGNARLIGVTTRVIRNPDTPTNTGAIDATELAWLEGQLQTLAGHVPFVVSHHPISIIDNGHGGTEARVLCATYNVRAWLAGHIHEYNSLTSDGLRVIINSSANYNRGTPLDLTGGMMVCDVYERQITFTHTRARAPWDTLNSVDVWTD